MDDKRVDDICMELINGKLSYRQKERVLTVAKWLIYGGDKIRRSDHPVIEQFKRYTEKNGFKEG